MKRKTILLLFECAVVPLCCLLMYAIFAIFTGVRFMDTPLYGLEAFTASIMLGFIGFIWILGPCLIVAVVTGIYLLSTKPEPPKEEKGIEASDASDSDLSLKSESQKEEN